MNKLKTFFLLIPFIGMFCWVMYYAHFVKNATEVVLPITGYDPRNLLSGHYIEFRINWAKANCHQANWNGQCPASDFSGVNRYYVSESKAKDLERFINNNRFDTEIVFAYQSGQRPVAKELLINGQPWHQLNKNKNNGSLKSLHRKKQAQKEADEILNYASMLYVLSVSGQDGGRYVDIANSGLVDYPYNCIERPQDIYANGDGMTHINLKTDCTDVAELIQEKSARHIVGDGCFVGGNCTLNFK